MKIDITLEITPELVDDARRSLHKFNMEHFGTHIDVMDKAFPLEYVERQGIFFDISDIRDREVTTSDIDLDKVKADMFVGFYSGFIEAKGDGTKAYLGTHPCLSKELIDALLSKKISLIGVDFSGVRNGKEHKPTDQYCADRGVFIVENLCSLRDVVKAGGQGRVSTYPVRYADMTGLPCRVVVDIADI